MKKLIIFALVCAIHYSASLGMLRSAAIRRVQQYRPHAATSRPLLAAVSHSPQRSHQRNRLKNDGKAAAGLAIASGMWIQSMVVDSPPTATVMGAVAIVVAYHSSRFLD